MGPLNLFDVMHSYQLWFVNSYVELDLTQQRNQSYDKTLQIVESMNLVFSIASEPVLLAETTWLQTFQKVSCENGVRKVACSFY